MALILEVLHPDGERTRHSLNGQTLTVGRGLANDIVLDDPYVDANHARVTLDEGGAVHVEDLGSVNGLVANEQRLFGRTIVRPGDLIRVGRTTIRVRDPNESIPPALRDQPAPVVTREGRAGSAPLLTAGPARWAIPLVALVAFAFNAWLGSWKRSSAGDIVSASLGFSILLLLWSGLWALASRIIIHQFRFLGHLAVASAIALGGLLWGLTDNWLEFFFPDAGITAIAGFLAMMALVAALVAGHLSLASLMPRRRRWRIGSIAAAIVLAIAGLSALTKDESFSDVPKYPATLKPIAASWVPTKSIGQFEGMSRALKDEVDQLAKK